MESVATVSKIIESLSVVDWPLLAQSGRPIHSGPPTMRLQMRLSPSLRELSIAADKRHSRPATTHMGPENFCQDMTPEEGIPGMSK
jgi:hypothetical protein